MLFRVDSFGQHWMNFFSLRMKCGTDSTRFSTVYKCSQIYKQIVLLLAKVVWFNAFFDGQGSFIQSSLAIFYNCIFVLSKWPQILPTTRWPFRGFMSAVSRLCGVRFVTKCYTCKSANLCSHRKCFVTDIC